MNELPPSASCYIRHEEGNELAKCSFYIVAGIILGIVQKSSFKTLMIKLLMKNYRLIIEEIFPVLQVRQRFSKSTNRMKVFPNDVSKSLFEGSSFFEK